MVFVHKFYLHIVSNILCFAIHLVTFSPKKCFCVVKLHLVNGCCDFWTNKRIFRLFQTAVVFKWCFSTNVICTLFLTFHVLPSIWSHSVQTNVLCGEIAPCEWMLCFLDQKMNFSDCSK